MLEIHPLTGERIRTEVIAPMTLDALERDQSRVELIGALFASRHPRLPRLISAAIRWGHLVLATPAVDGRTVRELLRADPRPGPGTLIGWFEAAMHGMTFALDHGICCPRFGLDSIVVTPDGEVKLLGFGVEQLRTGRWMGNEVRAGRPATLAGFDRAWTTASPGVRACVHRK